MCDDELKENDTNEYALLAQLMMEHREAKRQGNTTLQQQLLVRIAQLSQNIKEREEKQ